jgi:hypothetical protein
VAVPLPVVAEMAALPAVSEVLASPHSACIPPERCTKIAIPTRATKAVSRQYSAKSCPRSSECKALSKCRNIATTKPKISVKRRREHDHNLFRYGPIPEHAAVFSRHFIKSREEPPI